MTFPGETELDGKRRDRRNGSAKLLLMQLQARFGPVPDEVAAKVKSADFETISRWALRVLTEPTLEDVLGKAVVMSRDEIERSARQQGRREAFANVMTIGFLSRRSVASALDWIDGFEEGDREEVGPGAAPASARRRARPRQARGRPAATRDEDAHSAGRDMARAEAQYALMEGDELALRVMREHRLLESKGTLRHLLKSRFGHVPPRTAARIRAADEASVLQWVVGVVSEPTLEAVFGEGDRATARRQRAEG